MLRRITLPFAAVCSLAFAAWLVAPLPVLAQANDEDDFLESLAREADSASPSEADEEETAEADVDDEVDAEVESELAEDAAGEPFEAGEEAHREHEGLEQIRVVARRRRENLEDTPVAVTALGRNQLDEAQVREMNQIQDLVPNLTWTTGASGQGGSVVVRGVGKGAEDLVFDPGVGIYVDGVLLSRDAGQVLSMVDVEQIEVLRGPQGTLFGKNNVGGAINMITVKPQPDFEALMLVGYGNLSTLRTRAMVNQPLVEDALYMRVAWASETNDGYMSNADSGQNASDQRQISGMGAIRALPTDQLTIDVSGSWSRNHAHSRGGKCVYIGSSVAAQFVSLAIPPSQGGFSETELEAQCDRSFDLPHDQFTSDVSLLADVMSYGVWGTIAYELGDFGIVGDVVAKSITAWREQKPRLRDDTDMTSIPIIQRNMLAGQPTFFPDEKGPTTQRQITQEFQLQNTWWDERIHSTTGVYLYWDQARNDQEIWSLGGLYVAPDPAPLRGLTPNLQITSIDNNDLAVYHQTTWDIIEAVSLTGGVRWTQEKKRTGLEIYRFTSPPPATETSSPYLDVQDEDSATYSEWTPTVSLVGKTPERWIEPAGFDTVNAYFTYARGFKGGGFSAVQGGTSNFVPFAPEYLDSWELGLKSVAWGSRVRVNLAGFWGRYQDMQVVVTLAGAPFVVERVVENAAKAKTRGLELELQALPLDGLLLTTSIGYLNAYFDEYTNSARNEPRPIGNLPPATIDRSGDRFNNAPRLQTNLTAQYSMPYEAGPRWLDGEVTPRIEWLYESAVWLAGREATSLHQGYVNRLNARITWRFNGERSELAFWAKNLTDAYYFRSGIAGTISTYGIALRYYEPPRTFGFEASHRF